MITVDGSMGEGGGQILRSSLALSLVTGEAFRIEGIRARRKRPGLLRQHLTAVEAAAAVGRARTEGAALHSGALLFEPRDIVPGDYGFAVGTAGSATLVLQTVLPALVLARGPSKLLLEGGTHNPMAPPFDFLERAFLPLLGRMGARVDARLERAGFHPAGGGRVRASIEPVGRLARVDLLERGPVRRISARALVSRLPRHIAARELEEVRSGLDVRKDALRIEEVRDSSGPGNAVIIEIASEKITEVFTGFGRRGRRAEVVAREAVEEAREYLASGVPVGAHLADQIVLPLALAGGGGFRTVAPTPHTLTNIEVVRAFLEVDVQIVDEGSGSTRIELSRRAPP